MTAAGPRRIARRLLPEDWAVRRVVDLAARLIEGGARLGYAARAVVYLSVGAMALLAAFGLTPHATGAVEALEAWGGWPPGVLLLWTTGLGLYAFAGWRALQALFDADRLGATPAALAERAGKAFSGIVYGGLAVSVFGLLDAIEDLREVDDQAATQAAIQAALTRPGGDLLVIVLGVLVVLAGAGNAWRALSSHFTEALECGAGAARWAGGLARVGYLARGGVLAGAGLLTVSAGLHARASEADGLGGALEALKAQPGGTVWLAMAGLGLVAFAVFGFLKAGLRRIGC